MINLNEIAVGNVRCIPVREMSPIYTMPYSKEHRKYGAGTVVTFKCKKDYDLNLAFNNSIKLNDLYFYGLTLVQEKDVEDGLKEVILGTDTLSFTDAKNIAIEN